MCQSFLTSSTGQWNYPWWSHQMETSSALLAICTGNSPVPGEFPTQKPVTRSFDVCFFICRINGWVNHREAGDLRRYRAHYDVTVIQTQHPVHGQPVSGKHRPRKPSLPHQFDISAHVIYNHILCVSIWNKPKVIRAKHVVKSKSIGAYSSTCFSTDIQICRHQGSRAPTQYGLIKDTPVSICMR